MIKVAPPNQSKVIFSLNRTHPMTPDSKKFTEELTTVTGNEAYIHTCIHAYLYAYFYINTN